jgi:hypothetical protein
MRIDILSTLTGGKCHAHAHGLDDCTAHMYSFCTCTAFIALGHCAPRFECQSSTLNFFLIGISNVERGNPLLLLIDAKVFSSSSIYVNRERQEAASEVSLFDDAYIQAIRPQY